uniref:Uncharacterized protein n=1 Tax=Triticum urartu TaxID=4572 RepID=A0A8R7PJC4_TRIUA
FHCYRFPLHCSYRMDHMLLCTFLYLQTAGPMMPAPHNQSYCQNNSSHKEEETSTTIAVRC